MRDFDGNEFPLAYLITFRCYGTWLHGDERGIVPAQSRSHVRRVVDPSKTSPEEGRNSTTQAQPVTLNQKQRAIVEEAIREVCFHRKYRLRAISVRTNHAHTVVSALREPEPILDSFKSYSTRALRRAGLMPPFIKQWARHGSTIYLGKEWDVEKALEYGLLGQGDPPAFD